MNIYISVSKFGRVQITTESFSNEALWRFATCYKWDVIGLHIALSWMGQEERYADRIWERLFGKQLNKSQVES